MGQRLAQQIIILFTRLRDIHHIIELLCRGDMRGPSEESVMRIGGYWRPPGAAGTKSGNCGNLCQCLLYKRARLTIMPTSPATNLIESAILNKKQRADLAASAARNEPGLKQ